MPNLSPVEVMVVAMLALIVFGPDKLPGIARTIGRTLSDLRRMANDAKMEFQTGLDGDVEDEPVDDEPEEEGPDADANAPATERPQ